MPGQVSAFPIYSLPFLSSCRLQLILRGKGVSLLLPSRGFLGGTPRHPRPKLETCQYAGTQYTQQITAEGSLEKCKGLLVPPKDNFCPISKLEGNPCKESRRKAQVGTSICCHEPRNAVFQLSPERTKDRTHNPIALQWEPAPRLSRPSHRLRTKETEPSLKGNS